MCDYILIGSRSKKRNSDGDSIDPRHLKVYKIFTYLLPWNIDAAADKLYKQELGLEPPKPTLTFAIRG
jgi:hypothetical protein